MLSTSTNAGGGLASHLALCVVPPGLPLCSEPLSCTRCCSWWVLSKGAPEVVQGLLATVPPHYQKCYKVRQEGSRWGLTHSCGLVPSYVCGSPLVGGTCTGCSGPDSATPSLGPTLPPCSPMQHYASEGARVLALAYKQLPGEMTPSELRHLPRDHAESGLLFAGFAVFRSPLKDDSEPALRMLRESQHQLIMITGAVPHKGSAAG